VHRAYISAGSNIGDRKANLQFALTSLAQRNRVQKVSSCFETEPVGFLHQPWFMNLAVEIETPFNPFELLTVCKSIEAACGRVRTFPNAPRTLDLDILLFDDLVMSDNDLIIPHPRLAARRFVLAPLAQIAPEAVHPVFGKTVRELFEHCEDPSEVRLLQDT